MIYLFHALSYDKQEKFFSGMIWQTQFLVGFIVKRPNQKISIERLILLFILDHLFDLIG